jgi:ATP-dependent Clp protease protease subunit
MAIQAPMVIEVNDFTEDSSRKFEAQMNAAQQTGQTIIPIMIDSYGGGVYSLLRMVDVIQNSRVPVATIVTGKAMSCGAVLYTMGKEGYRFAGKQATILIHDVSAGAEGKVPEMKVTVQEAERLNNLIFSLMAKNTGHPYDFFMKILKGKSNTDWFIPIDEAKSLNIVNKIGVPELKTRVDVKYILE